MRASAILLLFLTAVSSFAQSSRTPSRSTSPAAGNVQSLVRQAATALADGRKAIEKDLQVLQELRAADKALIDPMQPNVAIQEALDHVGKARELGPEFDVVQNVVKAERALEEARRNSSNADFGRLRAQLREAIASAARVCARHAMALQDATAEWLTTQDLIVAHLRQLSDLTAACLLAVQ